LNVDNQLVDENGNILPQEDLDSDDEYNETNIEDIVYILIELER
jgi:hypothetical protein